MFELLWLPSARDELARLWLAADSALRARITASANALEHRRSRDPFAESESRDRNARITFEAPLAIRFEVDEDERRVWVIGIRIYPNRRA
jgi:hypothetical protein